MNVLTFEGAAKAAGKRCVRRARFEPHSTLAVSAASVTANSVRETLGSLLAAPVTIHLLAPVLPSPAAWSAICSGAQLYRIAGPLAEAAFVLREADALALAAAACGETGCAPRALSAFEQRIVERAVRALAASLAPVCGRELAPPVRVSQIAGYTTYFELLVEPLDIRLGIALVRDPVPRAGATLALEDLLDVQLEVAVELARGPIAGGAFLDLRPGACVPMKTRIGEPGLLLVGGAPLARGECGALRELGAMIIA